MYRVHKPLVITGSSRKDSFTKQLAEKIFYDIDHTLIDLLDYNIYAYNYSGQYPRDDEFNVVVKHLLDHETIVFATPVYWYSMSAHMKTLFDRFTDLVTINQSAGRQLKDKRTFLISIGTDDAMPAGFEIPFKRTSEYFSMDFNDFYYCKIENLNKELTDFKDLIEKMKVQDSI